MLKKFSFWIIGLIVLQFLTAAFHSVSFFVNPDPQNESERQLNDLMKNYQMDAGVGFHPTTDELFLALSICFLLLCVFGGLLNWYFVKKKLAFEVFSGVLLIESIIFGIVFIDMLTLTFLPPALMSGLTFLFCIASYLAVRRSARFSIA